MGPTAAARPPSTPSRTERSAGRKREGKHADRKREAERRIIDVALELIREGGVASLTTVAIAKRAGIHQPNFYAYFRNIDDLLVASARYVGERMHHHDFAAFEKVRAAVESGAPYEALSERYHAEVLDLLLAEPRFAELYHRHRADPSPYGHELRKIERRFVDTVTEQLWDWAIRAGLRGKHLPEIRLLAELQVSAVSTAVLLLLEGRETDRAVVARMLACNADATTRATLRRLSSEA